MCSESFAPWPPLEALELGFMPRPRLCEVSMSRNVGSENSTPFIASMSSSRAVRARTPGNISLILSVMTMRRLDQSMSPFIAMSTCCAGHFLLASGVLLAVAAFPVALTLALLLALLLSAPQVATAAAVEESRAGISGVFSRLRLRGAPGAMALRAPQCGHL